MNMSNMQTRGEEVKNPENFADLICTCPLKAWIINPSLFQNQLGAPAEQRGRRSRAVLCLHRQGQEQGHQDGAQHQVSLTQVSLFCDCIHEKIKFLANHSKYRITWHTDFGRCVLKSDFQINRWFPGKNKLYKGLFGTNIQVTFYLSFVRVYVKIVLLILC